ncbi:hypothetical protein [Variovorax terrae]|uniref:Uncharacterized protein n=1 Tax=Variovorax terrae TaxID=2923278 RepID=A0A9X2ANV4_9BURK|nr:hypothetical protein [Variovorax terrae]MCJ0764779.1 hypothetical protein [Variovorax terrae]
MDMFLLAMLIAFAFWALKSKDQGQRIALLGSHLGQYQIEKNMEALTQGYLRALGESDPERREQIWGLLRSTEQSLCDQFNRFAAEFSRADEASARVSKLPFYLPFATRLFPSATFDLRKALALHARGIAHAAQAQDGEAPSPKARAFTMSAELFLMQHTCHWFCKSRTVASARMLARHQTSYEQLIASVAPDTRAAYCALVGR